MRNPRGHRDADLAAFGHNVVVPHAAVRLRVFLESEGGGSPFLKQLRQRVGGLASHYEQSRVQLPETVVQIFEALQEEPEARYKFTRGSRRTCNVSNRLPPLVDPDVRRASEPRVDDEYAAEGGRAGEPRQQRGVVVQAQALPEPVDGVLLLGDACRRSGGRGEARRPLPRGRQRLRGGGHS